MKKYILIVLLFVSSYVVAGPTYVSGAMSAITSIPQGLLVRIGNSVLPDNCSGSPYGWMLLPEANKTMVSTALAMWVSGNRSATLYSAGIDSGTGFCLLVQFAPN